MEKTPIIVLVEQIKMEAMIATARYKDMQESKPGKQRNKHNDEMVDCIRNITRLAHAIEKLNEA